MAITNTNVTVNCSGNAGTTGGTATQITPTLHGTLGDPVPVTVYNPGTAPVFVGGSSVVSGNGVGIAPGGSASFNLVEGDNLYAISNTVTTTVSIMKARQ